MANCCFITAVIFRSTKVYNPAFLLLPRIFYAHTSHLRLALVKILQQSRAAEHEAFLNWLLETAQAHEVDAIIVAGDILIPDRRRAMRVSYTTVLWSTSSKPVVTGDCRRKS